MVRTNKKRTRRNKRVHKSRRNKRVQKSRRNKRVHKLKRTNGIRQMGGVLTDEDKKIIMSDSDYQVFNPKDLIFGELLGEVGVSLVHEGLLYPGTDEAKQVAIKLYKSESTWSNSYLKFIETKDITFQKVDGGPHLKVNNTLKYGSVVHPPGGPVKECSIMELYEGGDFLRTLAETDEGVRWELSLIKKHAGQILRQLIELHKVCGHGDIKPGNIALEIEEDEGIYLRLIDFDKFVGGTKVYQAPELRKQGRRMGDNWLQRCDMYSFGMTMYMFSIAHKRADMHAIGTGHSDVARAQVPSTIKKEFRGDHVFRDVMLNLLNEDAGEDADRYTAVQAYKKLFPDEAALLSAAETVAAAAAAEAEAEAEAEVAAEAVAPAEAAAEAAAEAPEPEK
jgi:serine/threonine protein kinase